MCGYSLSCNCRAWSVDTIDIETSMSMVDALLQGSKTPYVLIVLICAKFVQYKLILVVGKSVSDCGKVKY